MNFQGDNEVNQVWATGSSNTTINANGNCEFEEVDAYVNAGGTMQVKESVIDITGTVYSAGQMMIVPSDMKVGKPDPKYGDTSPYRICSETGVTLVREKNGQVKQDEVGGKKVHYVDTDGNDGAVVNLEAGGEPAYYRCAGETLTSAPRTGDQTNPFLFMAAGVASAATAAYAVRRREEH